MRVLATEIETLLTRLIEYNGSELNKYHAALDNYVVPETILIRNNESIMEIISALKTIPTPQREATNNNWDDGYRAGYDDGYYDGTGNWPANAGEDYYDD